MIHESKVERTKRLSESSISEWTKSDFEFMGYFKRNSLAVNGIPFGKECLMDNHLLDLDFENKILYLVCTRCKYTKFLHEKDDPHVQTQRKYKEWRFRSL